MNSKVQCHFAESKCCKSLVLVEAVIAVVEVVAAATTKTATAEAVADPERFRGFARTPSPSPVFKYPMKMK